MAKKRKTLVKNFNELIDKNDIENLKKVFDICELEAKGGYGKHTALSFYNVPNELVRWLVENGANIDAVDTYERTALHHHAMTRSGDVTLFLELGATVNAVDIYNNTPLHFAAGSSFNSASVKKLIAYGANTNAQNKDTQTPLEYALKRANNINIIELVEISKILLKINHTITQDMKDAITRIGENLEFHRTKFNTDSIKETDEALQNLYEIYKVVPVKKRLMHDGISIINIDGTTWKQQYKALWDFLIPSSGSAKTVQGEVVRISGKVRDEIYRNGGGNWNIDFKKMLDAFFSHISSGISLDDDELKKADFIIKDIRKNGDGETDDLNFLCKLATKWVLKNPNPTLLNKPNYKK